MINFRQNNTKYRPYYFFNDMINSKNFGPSLLDIEKITFKSTDAVIYHVEYIMMKSIYHVNIDSANSFYLIFDNVDECITEESNENKYLIFASTDKNKEVLKKYAELWDEIKNQIETINGGKTIKYGRNFI